MPGLGRGSRRWATARDASSARPGAGRTCVIPDIAVGPPRGRKSPADKTQRARRRWLRTRGKLNIRSCPRVPRGKGVFHTGPTPPLPHPGKDLSARPTYAIQTRVFPRQHAFAVNHLHKPRAAANVLRAESAREDRGRRVGAPKEDDLLPLWVGSAEFRRQATLTLGRRRLKPAVAADRLVVISANLTTLRRRSGWSLAGQELR